MQARGIRQKTGKDSAPKQMVQSLKDPEVYFFYVPAMEKRLCAYFR